MSESPKITAEQLGKLLLEKCPELAQKIVDAVNAAPDGNWISGSEEQVRDLGREFMRTAFEAALQQKVAAAEAAFSPSAGLSRKKTAE
jgi:hypothetical protein